MKYELWTELLPNQLTDCRSSAGVLLSNIYSCLLLYTIYDMRIRLAVAYAHVSIFDIKNSEFNRIRQQPNKKKNKNSVK